MCYYVKVLDEYVNYVFDVLVDMFFYFVFDEDEFKKEKNVVYEEIKMYEDVLDDIVYDLLSKVIYGNYLFGYLIFGMEEMFFVFNGDFFRQYMDNFYILDCVVIFVVGNVIE